MGARIGLLTHSPGLEPKDRLMYYVQLHKISKPLALKLIGRFHRAKAV